MGETAAGGGNRTTSLEMTGVAALSSTWNIGNANHQR